MVSKIPIGFLSNLASAWCLVLSVSALFTRAPITNTFSSSGCRNPHVDIPARNPRASSAVISGFTECFTMGVLNQFVLTRCLSKLVCRLRGKKKKKNTNRTTTTKNTPKTNNTQKTHQKTTTTTKKHTQN